MEARRGARWRRLIETSGRPGAANLPSRFDDEAALEDVMTDPSGALSQVSNVIRNLARMVPDPGDRNMSLMQPLFPRLLDLRTQESSGEAPRRIYHLLGME